MQKTCQHITVVRGHCVRNLQLYMDTVSACYSNKPTQNFLEYLREIKILLLLYIFHKQVYILSSVTVVANYGTITT